MQDRQLRTFRKWSKRLGLGPCGNEEVAAAGVSEKSRHLSCTEPISVRLYCSTRRNACAALQPTPIVLESSGIETKAKRAVNHAPALATGINGVEPVHQNIREPFGTVRSGSIRTISPFTSAKPNVSTSDMNGPIWRGGKFTTPATCLPISSSG